MKRSLLISLALATMVGSSALAQDTPSQKKSKSDAEKKAAQVQRIADLVDRLGDQEYKVRQKAYDDLVAIGPPAVSALEKAKQSEDPEVSAAASEALAAIRAGHKLPTPKTGEKKGPQTSQPDGFEERQRQGLRPMPGQEEMMKQLEGQFPEMKKLLDQMRGGKGGSGFRLLTPDDPMFKDLFGGKNPFGQLFGQDENEQDPSKRSRSRTFTWSNTNPRGTGPSASLGIRSRAVTPVLRSQLSLPAGQGLVVHQLLPKSFAQTQGLQRYDILLEAAGKPVRNELDLRTLVAQGGKVTVLRKAKRQVLTFAKAPKLKTPTRTLRPRRLRPATPRRAPKKAPEPKKDDDTRDF